MIIKAPAVITYHVDPLPSQLVSAPGHIITNLSMAMVIILTGCINTHNYEHSILILLSKIFKSI